MTDRDGAWWGEFFANRSKPCPFFVEWPDENLVGWLDESLITPGRVLEQGCGHGRNATYLASRAARSTPLTSRHGRSTGPGNGRSRPARRSISSTAPSSTASLGGGLGNSEGRLRAMGDKPPFSLRVLRRMKRQTGRGLASVRTSRGRCWPGRKTPLKGNGGAEDGPFAARGVSPNRRTYVDTAPPEGFQAAVMTAASLADCSALHATLRREVRSGLQLFRNGRQRAASKGLGCRVNVPASRFPSGHDGTVIAHFPHGPACRRVRGRR
jgi:hypothetical protein